MSAFISIFRSYFSAAILGFILVLGSGCSLLVPERSYIDEMNRESDPLLMAGRDFPIVGGDSGAVFRSRDEIKRRTPAGERETKKNAEALSLRRELEEKEADLSEQSVEQYARDKKYLPGDSDKLYYLSLSAAERSNYIGIRKQDMQSDLGKHQDFIENHSVHSTELYLGMNKTQVIQTWGRPVRVEIAGNPKNQNERWSYNEDGSVKQIYFESGKVQGWALDL